MVRRVLREQFSILHRRLLAIVRDDEVCRRLAIMPETRDALFVLGVGAGFFIAMYEWVTMIAETMP